MRDTLTELDRENAKLIAAFKAAGASDSVVAMIEKANDLTRKLFEEIIAEIGIAQEHAHAATIAKAAAAPSFVDQHGNPVA